MKKQIMEIVKYHDESGLLNKWCKRAKRRFLGLFAATLGASLLVDSIGKAIMPGWRLVRASEEASATSRGQGTIRAGQDC